MAKMIPIELSEEFLDDREKNGAEIKFFNACKSLPDSWTVLHNVLWEDEFHRPGETDFVVVSPDTGFVAIEVKGGGISRSVKSWYSTNRHGESNKIKNPYDQARNGKGTLIKKLRADHYFNQKYIPSCSMVCFPDIQEPIESIESSREGQILFGDLNNLENFILHFAQMQCGYAKGSLSLEDCQKIVDILIHDFEMPYFAPPEDSTQDNDRHAQEEIIPQPKPIPIASAFHQHKYAMYIVRETCVSKGYTLYQCECGEEYKENFTPEKEHTFEKTGTQEATCTDSGYDEYICSACGAKDRHSLAAKGHSFSFWEEHKPSTCIEHGEEIKKCLYCGLVETRPLALKEHNFGEWIEQNAPTCTEKGEETRKCSHCGATETRSVVPKGHNYGMWRENKTPTCTEKGKEIRQCLECGATDIRSIAMKQHNFGESTVFISPTCTCDGREIKQCLDCGTTENRILLKKGHSFGRWITHTEPTCTEEGKETRKCLNCGFSEIRQVAKKGHTFGEWTIQKNPTCTEQGEEIKQCSRCGITESRVIEPMGHKWVEQKDGIYIKILVCTQCGKEEKPTETEVWGILNRFKEGAIIELWKALAWLISGLVLIGGGFINEDILVFSLLGIVLCGVFVYKLLEGLLAGDISLYLDFRREAKKKGYLK